MKLHKAARIKVLYGDMALTQDYLILPNGEVRERGFSCLSETVEPGETFLEAAIRGLREEIGLNIPTDRLSYIGEEKEVKPSPTTGELKEYWFQDYQLLISEDEYYEIPEIITEEDGNKIIFRWEFLASPKSSFCIQCDTDLGINREYTNEAGECPVCGMT